MDPVSAIGIVSAALSFVTFSTSLVKGAIQIHDATQSDQAGSRSRESVIAEMQRFSDSLYPQASTAVGGGDLLRLASHCREVSDRLLALLTKLKPKNPSSKSQTLRAAIRSKMHESSIDELEASLDACRSQLHLELTYNMGRRTEQLLASLINASRQDVLKFEQLQTSLDNLRQAVHVSSIDPETQDSFRRLVGLHEDALAVGARRRIIQSLSFQDMRQRYEAVDDPHADTFRWVVEKRSRDYGLDSQRGDHGNKSDEVDEVDEVDEDYAEILAMQALARQKYSRWLRSSDGILHVSGKLGSGKSTLMKLLFQCPETRTGLRKWADGRTLVFAAFFFWKPGSTLQNSIPGLTRSLLYDVLSSCQTLIPDVLPECWKRVNDSDIPWHHWPKAEITDTEIQVAFRRLLQHMPDSQHCFCFFIDGLDEYTETPRQDRRHLVDILKSWYEGSPGTVKLCVSSREDNVFMNAFPADARLRIHHLTEFDLRDYVKDQLKHVDDDEINRFLIREITSKSQGIFLWVTLVVKLVREKIEDGGNLASLKVYLEMLPKEMNELFDHILKSMHEADHKRAYQIFAMMELAKTYRGWNDDRLHFFNLLQLCAIPLLEKYDVDDEFALRDDLEKEFGHTTLENQNALGLKRLNGWCRGLVEVDNNSWHTDWYWLIEYTHRSVYDFLEMPHIRPDMELLLRDFDTLGALTQLAVATLRVWAQRKTECEDVWLALIDINMAHKQQDKLWHLLDCGYVHANFHPNHDGFPTRSEIDSFHLYPGDTSWSETDRVFAQRVWAGSGLLHGRPTRQVSLRDMLSFASYHNNYQWILRELDHRPLSVPIYSETAILMTYGVLAGIEPDYRIIELLLDRRILTVHIATDLMPSLGNGNDVFQVIGGFEVNRESTVWELYLIAEFMHICLVEGNVNPNERWATRFSQVAELFLVCGADPHFSGSVGWKQHDPTIEVPQLEDGASPTAGMSPMAMSTTSMCDSDNEELGEIIYGVFYLGVSRDKFVIEFRHGRSKYKGLPQGQSVIISLRDWIDQSELVNKERLLQLIDGTNIGDEGEGKLDATDGEPDVKSTTDTDNTTSTREPSRQGVNVLETLRPRHSIPQVQIVATLSIGLLLGVTVSRFWARQ